MKKKNSEIGKRVVTDGLDQSIWTIQTCTKSTDQNPFLFKIAKLMKEKCHKHERFFFGTPYHESADWMTL